MRWFLQAKSSRVRKPTMEEARFVKMLNLQTSFRGTCVSLVMGVESVFGELPENRREQVDLLVIKAVADLLKAVEGAVGQSWIAGPGHRDRYREQGVVAARSAGVRCACHQRKETS
ncbi:MAG: hypothetical protein H6Q86_3171 [candidate division NC10 bacterium]|nr:hypothetical protein [candidate division NC10 bacterium]